MKQRTYIVFGAGGVGKTTTAAAFAIALAKRGVRTLVLTTDPARRLADVLGTRNATTISPVPGVSGLDYYMPNASTNTREIVDELLAGSPEIAMSLHRNPIFELLCSGLAGVHELMILASLGSRTAGYDAVVIDTAPSEHALELLSLPSRIATLIDSRALSWLSKLSPAKSESRRGISMRLIDWGQQRLLSQFENVLGGPAVAHCLELLRAVMMVRPQLSNAIASAKAILTGARTEYMVVLAPRHGAERQAQLFTDALAAVAKPPTTFIFNQVPISNTWANALAGNQTLQAPLRAAIDIAIAQASNANDVVLQTTKSIHSMAPRAHVVSVPAIAVAQASDVVAAIAVCLDTMISDEVALVANG
jgi:anion-transporting  ArsA/GET3 family ATPase